MKYNVLSQLAFDLYYKSNVEGLITASTYHSMNWLINHLMVHDNLYSEPYGITSTTEGEMCLTWRIGITGIYVEVFVKNMYFDINVCRPRDGDILVSEKFVHAPDIDKFLLPHVHRENVPSFVIESATQ